MLPFLSNYSSLVLCIVKRLKRKFDGFELSDVLQLLEMKFWSHAFITEVTEVIESTASGRPPYIIPWIHVDVQHSRQQYVLIFFYCLGLFWIFVKIHKNIRLVTHIIVYITHLPVNQDLPRRSAVIRARLRRKIASPWVCQNSLFLCVISYRNVTL